MACERCVHVWGEGAVGASVGTCWQRVCAAVGQAATSLAEAINGRGKVARLGQGNPHRAVIHERIFRGGWGVTSQILPASVDEQVLAPVRSGCRRANGAPVRTAVAAVALPKKRGPCLAERLQLLEPPVPTGLDIAVAASAAWQAGADFVEAPAGPPTEWRHFTGRLSSPLRLAALRLVPFVTSVLVRTTIAVRVAMNPQHKAGADKCNVSAPHPRHGVAVAADQQLEQARGVRPAHLCQDDIYRHGAKIHAG